MGTAIAQYTAADVRDFDAGEFLSRLLEPLDDDHPVGVRWDEFDDGAVAFVADRAQDAKLATAARAEQARRQAPPPDEIDIEAERARRARARGRARACVSSGLPMSPGAIPPHAAAEVAVRAVERLLDAYGVHAMNYYTGAAFCAAAGRLRALLRGECTEEDVREALRVVDAAYMRGKLALDDHIRHLRRLAATTRDAYSPRRTGTFEVAIEVATGIRVALHTALEAIAPSGAMDYPDARAAAAACCCVACKTVGAALASRRTPDARAWVEARRQGEIAAQYSDVVTL